MGTCTPTRSASTPRDPKVRFGRVRVWFEDSPVSLAAAISLSLVVVGFFWLVTMRSKRHPSTIYTIGFGNRSGEAQLLRIANESGGKYRYVEFVER